MLFVWLRPDHLVGTRKELCGMGPMGGGEVSVVMGYGLVAVPAILLKGRHHWPGEICWSKWDHREERTDP